MPENGVDLLFMIFFEKPVTGKIGCNSELETHSGSDDVLCHLFDGDPREIGEFFLSDELMIILTIEYFDLFDQGVTIPLTPPGNDLDIFGVNDATFEVHVQLKIKVT